MIEEAFKNRRGMKMFKADLILLPELVWSQMERNQNQEYYKSKKQILKELN